jgi:hypothetical protein
MTEVKPDDNRRLLWVIALFAILARLCFILIAPNQGGIFCVVAENILSGCGVSASPPESGECVLVSTANQGPGYPAFIAFFWLFGGHSDFLVLLVQSLINVAAIIYLVDAVHSYTSSKKVALIIGAVLALSPLQIAWPRQMYTETLAISGAMWIFAEILKSIHQSKLRVLSISIGLILTTFIRYDGILLSVPVAVAGLMIHRPVEAIRRVALIGLICMIPWGGWTLRNFSVGVPHILPHDPYTDATGYVAWGRTWWTNEYQRMAYQGPLFTDVSLNSLYSDIKVDEKAYRSKQEKDQVLTLLEELKQFNKKAFPKHIDDKFAELAAFRIQEDPLAFYLFIPLQRALALWTNFYNSFGWPTELVNLPVEDRLEISKGDTQAIISLALNNPFKIMGKLIVTGWRLLLYLLFLTAAIMVYFQNDSKFKVIMTAILSFVIARSIFSGWMYYVESRYTVMQMTTMEIIVVMWILCDKRIPIISHWLNKKNSG